jgi:glycosyltransferase involved in cell wall biosynthesis
MKQRVTSYIPTKNSGKTIERSLKSIINQTYKPGETFVVDGNSVDITHKIVKKFPTILKIQVLPVFAEN